MCNVVSLQYSYNIDSIAIIFIIFSLYVTFIDSEIEIVEELRLTL